MIINSSDKRTLKIFLLLLGVLLYGYAGLSGVYYGWTKSNEIRNNLSNLNLKVINDIEYQEGEWNVASYLNDTEIKNDRPLYVISSDGFLIDRKNKINGFLDNTDNKFNLSFQTPRNLTTPDGKKWRMYSLPIGDHKGIILVGYNDPEYKGEEEIDLILRDTAGAIAQELIAAGGNPTLPAIDNLNLDKKVVYEIVDNNNHLIKNYGGVPSYIDRQYVDKYLKETSEIIKDSATKERFLIYAKPVYNKELTKVIGVVISASPINAVIGKLIKQTEILLVIVTLIMAVVIIGIIVIRRRKKDLKKKTSLYGQNGEKGKRGKIKFSKEKSLITSGDKIIAIPPASLQFFVVKALFSNPKKRWEYHEILKQMGENSVSVKKNWRKLYDAARAINEKSKKSFGYELIIFDSKTIRFNPEYAAG